MDVDHQMYIHLRRRGAFGKFPSRRHSKMTINRPERRTLGDLRRLPNQGRGDASLDAPALTGSRLNLLTAVAKDKQKQKKSKKDAQLVLRLNKDLRDRFIDACQDLDTSAAREVRRFIKRFLRRYDKGELDD